MYVIIVFFGVSKLCVIQSRQFYAAATYGTQALMDENQPAKTRNRSTILWSDTVILFVHKGLL